MYTCYRFSGDFAFKGITNTLQVHVEKEKEVEYAVMPRYADRSECWAYIMYI